MKNKQELLISLYHTLDKLQHDNVTLSPSSRQRLIIRMELLYEILGEDVPEFAACDIRKILNPDKEDNPPRWISADMYHKGSSSLSHYWECSNCGHVVTTSPCFGGGLPYHCPGCNMVLRR